MNTQANQSFTQLNNLIPRKKSIFTVLPSESVNLPVTTKTAQKITAVGDSMFSRLVPRDAELVAKLALSSDPAQADN